MSASEDDSFMIDDKSKQKNLSFGQLLFFVNILTRPNSYSACERLKAGNILQTILGVVSYFHTCEVHYVFFLFKIFSY